MSRRSIPPLAPSDLRDHADEGRIDRIWERLERDLEGVPEAAPARRSGLLVFALAATLVAFGGGVLVGKRFWSAPGGAMTIHPAPEHVDTDIFAAGEQDREFDLPGVGQLRLKSGATVELDRIGSLVTLRLVQGEASVDRVASGGLAIVAGEARLSTKAGSSVTVHKNNEQLDVRVDDGSAELASPAGTQHLKPGEEAREVPIHSAVVASAQRNELPKRRAPAVPPVPHGGDPAPDVAVVSDTRSWSVLYAAGKDAEAFESLKHQPGGIEGAIAAARSAKELWDIRDVARIGRDDTAENQALVRVFKDFPQDQNAQVAAHQLMENASSSAEKKKYSEYLLTLWPKGPYAEDALCNQLRGETRKLEATRMAQQYRDKYPDGKCEEDAARIIRGEEPFASDAAARQGAGGASGSPSGDPSGAASAAPRVDPPKP